MIELRGTAKDLTGHRFGRLTAMVPTKMRDRGCIVWKCKCTCGQIIFRNSYYLTSGITKSCGCLALETHTTHGMHKAPIYQTWKTMIQRCENPNHTSYKYYGSRGITVCDRWHSFEAFFEDMEPRPKEMTLDRYPDNNGNYEPNNCRWATPKEQGANKRPNSHGPNKQCWFVAGYIATQKIYKSNNQSKFAQEHGIGNSGISQCLTGKLKTYKGWKFKRLKSPPKHLSRRLP